MATSFGVRSRSLPTHSGSGTPVFAAKAKVRVPEGVALDDLQTQLEALASDLMVEIEFSQD